MAANNSPHQVFHYCPFDLAGTGGVETHISRLCQEFTELGWVAEAALEPKLVNPQYRSAWIHSHGDRLPPKDLLRRFGLDRWIHTLHGTSIGRAVACREFLGLRNYISGAKEALAAHLARGVICVSESVRQQAMRFFAMSGSRPLAVIHNGADLGFSSTKQYEVHEPYFLFLGRGQDRVKNVALLERAFMKVQNKSRCSLIAAPGDGFSISHERLIRIDNISREQKVSLIAGAAALVVPSFYESDSIVVWEAMAAGTPIVASQTVGVRPYLENYSHHIFIDPRHEDSLINAMLAVLASHQRATPLVRTWGQVARETLGFYNSLKN